MSLTKITSVDQLVTYLQTAIQLEHATIPPYLTALYSMHPGANSDAGHLIRVVAVEEMLHLTLAANILNAVGGSPDLTTPGFVPKYPTYLPNGETDFEVGLQRFSREGLETFLSIERPARADGHGMIHRRRAVRGILPSYTAMDDSREMHFYSIGDFYQEISRGLAHLDGELARRGETLFCGDVSRQIAPEYYYSGGGEIIAVTDLASAQQAIRLISEQGEGFGGGIFDYEGELSHYHRFQQIVLGRYYMKGDQANHPSGGPVEVDWAAAYPIKANASISDYPERSAVREAALDFNMVYEALLARITQALNGQPQEFVAAVGDMFRIREKACQLMRNPIPGVAGVHAAPTFEMPTQEGEPA